MPEWGDIPELRSLIEKWATEGVSREEIVARLQQLAAVTSEERPTTDEKER
jgi:hypothetical protein